MQYTTKNRLTSIAIAIVGLSVILLIPSQIDLGRVTGRSLSRITPRTLPYFVSILIVALSLFEALRRPKESNNEDSNSASTENKKYFNVLLTAIGIIAWIAIVPYVGFIVSTALLLVAAMLLMGNKKWIQLLIVPLLTAWILNYLFTDFVGRNLPQGTFFF